MEAAGETLLSIPVTTGFFVLIAAAARALGALFGLWGLYFVMGPAAILRFTLALVISAPLIVGQGDDFVALVGDANRFALFVVPVREFVIGFALGLLMSIPFFAVLAAAMLVDQYSGDFAPGLQAPESQTVGAYSALNVVMILFLFVEAGGFLMLVKVLYDSFAILPPAVPGLAVAPDFAAGLGDILQSVMVALIVFALPVILILLLLEFAINMMARLTEQIKLPSIDFLAKNIALTLLMPLLVLGLIRLMQKALDDAPDPLVTLMRLITP